MSKRHHNESDYIEWLKSMGCIFYAPLSENDTTDKISGVNGSVQYSNSVTWDTDKNMYLFSKNNSYSPSQGIMVYSGLNLDFPNLNNVEFTLLYDINVKVGGYHPSASPNISPKWIAPIVLGERKVIINMENSNPSLNSNYKMGVIFPNHNSGKHISKWYVNGSQTSSFTYTSAMVGDYTIRDRVYINYCNSNAYTGCQFYLKDMMIFNKELTINEIRKIQGYE